MAELWYRLTKLPDLTLNKYASLKGNGVDGVIEKHIAFLRQLNRKGIVSGLSYHLFYLYVSPEDKSKDAPGHRLQIFFMIRGKAENMESIPALVSASPLADFYELTSKRTCTNCGSVFEGVKPPEKCPLCGTSKTKFAGNDLCSIEEVLKENNLDLPTFNACAILTKTETLLPAGNGEGEDYYMLREWDMNEDGRLYNMCNMMEALNHTALYRVDLYPVEKSVSLRESLRKPMNILRRRQDDRSSNSKRDYDGKDVLDNYEDLIEKYDSSPHFIANILVLANGKEDAVAILDAAGSESLLKGKYNIATFSSNFNPLCFIDGEFDGLENMRERMVVRKGRPGLIVCRDDTVAINLNYLPTLFSLEEIAPFFRLPALYDGETIQIAKETAPAAVNKDGALFLGKDKNGYYVFFPLSLLPKHAFVSGVPGSGKTNTMHHITSSLWKNHGIPFLVLEPAKQEYRALANDPTMKDLYLFSPNADMSFPLHINPFEMPKGTLVAEHIRRLCSVFEGAFPLEPPMPFLLDTAIEAVYRELGWIPEHVYSGDEKQENTDKKRALPTMSMLYRRLEQELKSTQYSDEVRGNLESALKVRIGSLLRREMGDVFDVPESTFIPEKWLEIPAVIELESMGTGPANFLTLMLCALIRETLKVDPKRENSSVKSKAEGGEFKIAIEKPGCFPGKEIYHIKGTALLNEHKHEAVSAESESGRTTISFINGDLFEVTFEDKHICGYYEIDAEKQVITLFWGNKDIRHVIFIEEAHNLIGPESEEKTGADADPKQAATAFVVKMLAEVRALKEGIVIADQLPTVMAQEVLKNTGLKIGLKITSADDRSLLGSTMAANAMQLEQMATFNIGEALVFYGDLMRPFTMRIKEWWGELKDSSKKADMVSPKNDAALRDMIADRATYRDENLRSIQIIGSKYFRLLIDIENRANPCEYWLNAVAAQAEKINRLYSYLERVELGKVQLNDEDKAAKWDQLESLQLSQKSLLADKPKILEALDIINTVDNWILALERLKNGRWARFGASEAELIKITLLQTQMCDRSLQLYKSLVRAAGETRDTKRVVGEIEKISVLSKELYENLSTYIRLFGTEVFRKK